MAIALTTKDNPYNPLKDFENWWRFDTLNGYDTCSYLDRLSYLSDGLTDKENEEEIERVIDKIIADDPFGIYMKVVEPDDESNSPLN